MHEKITSTVQHLPASQGHSFHPAAVYFLALLLHFLENCSPLCAPPVLRNSTNISIISYETTIISYHIPTHHCVFSAVSKQ